MTIQTKLLSGTSLLYSLLCCTGLFCRLSVWDETIQMKAIEQYFHVVLFIVLYKVVLTFRSADETLMCDHSNESY